MKMSLCVYSDGKDINKCNGRQSLYTESACVYVQCKQDSTIIGGQCSVHARKDEYDPPDTIPPLVDTDINAMVVRYHEDLSITDFVEFGTTLRSGRISYIKREIAQKKQMINLMKEVEGSGRESKNIKKIAQLQKDILTLKNLVVFNAS